jgi:hypothetical protein
MKPHQASLGIERSSGPPEQTSCANLPYTATAPVAATSINGFTPNGARNTESMLTCPERTRTVGQPLALGSYRSPCAARIAAPTSTGHDESPAK